MEKGSGILACKPLILCSLLAASTLAVYFQVYHFGYVNFDDPDYIHRNAHVLSGFRWENLTWAFTTFECGNWHPLTWLSLQADVAVFGNRPGCMHLVNVGLHTASTLVLFRLLHMATGSVYRSVWVAALFALHPLHVESVAWLSERKDVLSTLLGFLTIAAYIGYVRWPGLARYGLVLLLFALGLLAKPMLVTLPVILLLLDFWPLGRIALANDSFRETIRQVGKLALEKLPLFLLAVASSVVTYVAQHVGGAVSSVEEAPLSLRFANAGYSIIKYILMAIWPKGLAVFYPHPLYALSIPFAMMALGLVMVLTWAVVRLGRQSPYLFTGWFWYLITLLPVLGLIQVGGQALADRYTYVPLVGLFVISGWGVWDLAQRWRIPRQLLCVLAGLVLGTLSVLSARQVNCWRNSMSLFARAALVTQRNPLAHRWYGNVLIDAGRYQEAEREFQALVKLLPGDSYGFYGLGDAINCQGRTEEALTCYRRAHALDPTNMGVRFQLAFTLLVTKHIDEAIPHFEAVSQYQSGRILSGNALKPNAPVEAHLILGTIYRGQKRLDEAYAHFNAALRTDPDSLKATLCLVSVLDDLNRCDEAIAHMRRCIEIAPGRPALWCDLARLLIKAKKHEQAVEAYKEVLRLDPQNMEAKNGLSSNPGTRHSR